MILQQKVITQANGKTVYVMDLGKSTDSMDIIILATFIRTVKMVGV